ncbi:MAG: SpoIIE family protein phosphatase [Bacteroidetes bacterium]|nr:SpoIIE family protein phosphatase [Bacteroidota bacterium]
MKSHKIKYANLKNIINNILSYRILFILSGIAYMIFPFILKKIEPNSYDPIWQRITICFLIFLTYLLTFYFKRVKNNMLILVYILSYIITFHYEYLMYMNKMSLGYSIGALAIIPCIIILFKDVKSLISYIVLSLSGILFIFYLLKEPIINFTFFMSIVITIDIIMFLVVVSRITLINSSNNNNYNLTKSNLRLRNAVETIKLFNSKLQQQKEEILTQRDLIENKNIQLEKKTNVIEQKNKDFTDSVNYALRIQSALLPSQNYIDNILSNYFILYKPKDIVSGDFFWVKEKNNKTIIVIADCTGHGVPGAFMSILGITILNEITENYNLNANEILNHLRQDIIDLLYKYSDSLNTRDGMDLSLCIVNNKTKNLQFAGANNPLYLVRNNDLLIYKGDKMQIGIPRDGLSSFTNQEIELQEGDICYIFTDGYADQFDNTNENRFKRKTLQKLLVDINEKSMKEQKIALDDTIEKWKGDNEQTDDISFLGVKF